MIKVYGIVGTSQQTIVESSSYSPMPNEVLMQTERPSDGTWIAREDGTWEEYIPVEEATWQDKIEAQVMYTALITDSLLEDGESDV